jgi:hypothetical protein
MWVHRIFNGVFPAVVQAALGTYWLGEPAGAWRHKVSLCAIWASIPVGILFAAITHRFSIVEGLAGEVGYEDDSNDKKPLA